MLTKSAHIHFVVCEEYRQNVSKMGESDWRIVNTGSLNADNMIHLKRFSKNELFKSLGLNEQKKTILLTYHPVTLDFSVKPIVQINNIFEALDKFNFQVVITAPNADAYRDEINKTIINEINKKDNYFYFESIGMIRYHSLINYCDFVIGNSSSGLSEVPFYKLPTILSSEFRKSLKNMKFKFGNGSAALKMVQHIEKIKIDDRLLRKELDFKGK